MYCTFFIIPSPYKLGGISQFFVRIMYLFITGTGYRYFNYYILESSVSQDSNEMKLQLRYFYLVVLTA